MIEQFYDLRPEVLALDRKALDLCRAQFAHVEEIRDYNQLKMLRAFTDCGVEARHFWGSSGYGVWDDSRNKLEEVFARCMGAEAALVRPQFMRYYFPLDREKDDFLLGSWLMSSNTRNLRLSFHQ